MGAQERTRSAREELCEGKIAVMGAQAVSLPSRLEIISAQRTMCKRYRRACKDSVRLHACTGLRRARLL